MSHLVTKVTRPLALAALLVAPAFAAPTNGWCHLTPWTDDSPSLLDFYGWNVELEDGWAFVMNRGDDTVDAYRRDGGTFVKVQTIASPSGPYDMFGSAIERDGDDLYIGAPFSDLAGQSSGAVFRYSLAGDTWTYAQTILSPWADAYDRFGESIDVDDGWLAVGGTKINGGGAIDVLRKLGGNWVGHARLQHPDSVVLGSFVAIRGTADGLYANVFAGDTNPYGHEGAVFHFRVHPFGHQVGPVLQAPVPLTNEGYGWDLDFDGEHLVVGACWTLQAGTSTGAAYVYDVDGEVFPPVIGLAETLLPEPGQVGGEFGKRVALADGRIAIGAPHSWTNEVAQAGAVYVYRKAIFGNGWDLEDRLVREGGQDGDLLGHPVALDGDLVLAAAWNAGGSAIGEAVLFSLAPQDLDGGLAPADVLATSETYGTGKAGSLGVPSLTIAKPPVIGESSIVVLSGVPIGTTPVLFIGFAQAEIPFDQGALLVLDPIAVTLPTATILTAVGMQWLLPDDVALAGFDVCAQAMLIDPNGSGPKKTAQSRGLKVTLGY